MHPALLFERDLLFVSGKGGTGKSSVAAAVALAAARLGKRVLLVEVEGRGEMTRTLGVTDPGFREAAGPEGIHVLSVQPREALVEYLELFRLDRAARPLLRSGAVDQVIEAAPGFRDLLVCGKLYEVVRARVTREHGRARPRYDLVVVDAPPTGQIVSFLAAPATFAELIRVGRVKHQSAAIARMLRTRSRVALVAVPEEMAVVETVEAVPALLRVGAGAVAVVANRVLPAVFPRGTAAAGGRLDGERVAAIASAAGTSCGADEAAGMLHAARVAHDRRRLQRGFLRRLEEVAPVLELPDVPGGESDVVPALAEILGGALDAGGGTVAADAARRAEAPESTARPRAQPPVVTPPSTALSTRTAPAITALDRARVVVVCGAGGVGKTTVSAALAVAVASSGRRTALLTVDPARRLATAFGLPSATGTGKPTAVRIGRSRRLDVMQLDAQRTFDDLVGRHAGSPERRERILRNPFYARIADSLSGTQEYMAMERLHELATQGRHETLVIDTPPTRKALSFLDAPGRLDAFLGGRVFRWMVRPTARAGRLSLGLARFGAAAFARTVGRIVGGDLLADIVEFLSAFEGMYGGFRHRAVRVLELMRSSDCSFVVVALPTRPSLEEAGLFLDRLAAGGMHAAAVIVNRWHRAVGGPEPPSSAVEALRSGGPEERAVAAVLAHAVRSAPRRRAEAAVLSDFVAAHVSVPVVTVPELATDVHDLNGLRAVARHLPTDRSATRSAETSDPEPGDGAADGARPG